MKSRMKTEATLTLINRLFLLGLDFAFIKKNKTLDKIEIYPKDRNDIVIRIHEEKLILVTNSLDEVETTFTYEYGIILFLDDVIKLIIEHSFDKEVIDAKVKKLKVRGSK